MPCMNQLSVLNSGSNAVSIQWYGNYILQAATNLVPPIIWTPVQTGSVAPNTANWTSPPAPPVQFFRLYAPTN